MKLIGRLLGISLLILFFLAGLFLPRLLKILKKEPVFPDPGMPPSAAVKVEPLKVLKPEDLTLKTYRYSVSHKPVINVEDQQRVMPVFCGNGKVEEGEDFFNCPEDCAKQMFPEGFDLERRKQEGIQDEEMIFCGGESTYLVNAADMLIFKIFSGNKGDDTNKDSYFEVWEEETRDRSWGCSQRYNIPDKQGINTLIGYTPERNRIRLEGKGNFCVSVYSMGLTGKILASEEMVTYKNKEYGFAVDVIAGFHVEEHAWMDNQASANPQLVWQASFFYDGYGNDLSGKSAKPAIEISIEETLFRNLQEAFLESSVPCGMQLRGMCQKIMPCSCGLSTQEYDFQGIKGRVAEIECFKGMRGLVFLKGKRLYKFLFLSDLAGHRVFTLKKIEAMLKTIRFEE